MRLLFVADGRSPIALNWIAYFTDQGYEVYLASTFACSPDLKLAGSYIVPAAFSEAASGAMNQGGVGANEPESRGEREAGGMGAGVERVWSERLRKWVPVGLRTKIRQWLGPFTLPKASQRLKDVIKQVKPDLIHAMRIPYEGMLAALADPAAPLLVSIWGNDFTLHAVSNLWMGSLTRRTLYRADAIHADCQRDIRLAQTWGFPLDRPYRVLPGGGGVQLNQFYPAEEPPREPLVINPRGLRAYVRNDTFFQAVPLVLKSYPQARFICPTMAGEAEAQGWAEKLKIENFVELLPHQTRLQMAELFRQSQVIVSPSTHDGTPNTLLEAMACGCFPVVGDIESLREWITPGVNGLLVDPGDPQALADAIVLGLEHPGLRRRAATHNYHLVEERAEYHKSMQAAELFYRSIH